ncbi:zinc-binding dehydrogenase [Pseudofrankia inefficax]|uniref:Alcohol dehydrogenase GroES domain protein n=1 Tax=Pseudofrankia inefficax (strain DSM 45817 / CECT 9037 / DDB 130130 / EuI1c) TaxID=298654 RepID=E3IXD4_PSEI1|nr:alcohol dehydrogenase catalytic domain-containing protein [Pseudofrankia inefficax]ADP85034.1 Alcohol dehydrogenase GroES domain protein [Pseudofrankia inefficax]
MIAARLHGPQDIRIEDIPEPEPGAGEVKLAVAHNGLCGTDLAEFFAGPRACTTVPHPLTGGVLPQVMGHEFAGVVAAVGAGVADVAVGDQVCVEPLYSCGDCDRCHAGLPQLCRQVMTHGICSHGGGLAGFTVVPATMVHRLPASMSLAEGALVEPMSVAFNGVLRSGVEPGQSAVVFGAGPIGIGVMFGLRAVGVEDILLVEPAPARRAAVAALGVADVLDPEATDVADEVRRRTAGRGVDVAVDCAGAAATFAAAPAVLRARGRYVGIAFSGQAVSFTPWVLTRSEIELTGSLGYAPGVFARVIDLMAGGAFPTKGWVEQVGLDELREVFDDLRAGRRLKILVDLPTG